MHLTIVQILSFNIEVFTFVQILNFKTLQQIHVQTKKIIIALALQMVFILYQ